MLTAQVGGAALQHKDIRLARRPRTKRSMKQSVSDKDQLRLKSELRASFRPVANQRQTGEKPGCGPNTWVKTPILTLGKIRH